MKHFINSFLVSLLLTVLIGSSFYTFAQGTFFTPTINLVTQICMVLLLVAVWYIFLLDLFQNLKNQQNSATANEELSPAAEPVFAVEDPSEPEAIEEAESTDEPDLLVVDTDNEPVVMIPTPAPTHEWSKAPESDEKPTQTPAEKEKSQWLTRVQRKRLNAELEQKKNAEKTEKLKRAAKEKQAQRARKQEEDTIKQQKKLADLKAQAAQKKAAANSKKTSWDPSEPS